MLKKLQDKTNRYSYFQFDGIVLRFALVIYYEAYVATVRQQLHNKQN